MANYQQTQALNGLGTTTILNAPNAGVYFVNGQLSLPRSVEFGQSAVVSVVKQNGSTIYTGAAGATGFQIPQIVCAAADVITVVLSSSASADQPLNAVRGVVAAGNTF